MPDTVPGTYEVTEQDQGPCSYDAYLQVVGQTIGRELSGVSEVGKGRAGVRACFPELLANVKEQASHSAQQRRGPYEICRDFQVGCLAPGS